MDIEHRRDAGFDGTQELKKFGAAMASMCLANDRPCCDVEGREQRRRAMALVVVSAFLWNARGQRQQRLRTVECLDLALFVDTQRYRHQRLAYVQADDIAHVLDRSGRS